MKRIAIIIALLAAGVAPAAAQQLNTGGLMVDKDIMMPADLFDLSQTQFNFGTARSMAMAGAFTSLGADASSMSINPAGLGMYRRNEVSITPLMTFERSSNSAPAYGRNGKNRFSLGSFGFIFNAYEGSGKLVSFNIGFGYTRLQDLNYRYSLSQGGNVGSIADMYSKQLDYAGMHATDIMGNNLNWSRVSSELWNAVLGYKCGLTDDPDNNGQWYPSWISGNRDDMSIDQFATVESRGSVGEYAVSMGANIDNKFYIGLTLGIQSLYQEKDYYYDEQYFYSGASSVNPEGVASDLDYQLLYSRLNQTTIVEGTGVNLKLGFTWRPVESLRIGAAIHTPTYFSLKRRYQAAMASATFANRHTNPDITPDPQGYLYLEEITPVLKDDGADSWSYITPTRLLLGASYTLGDFGVLAVDYERDWYNGIRMKDAPISTALYNDTFRTTFKGSNTVRMGLEVRPLPFLSVRAGFGYSGSWLKDDHTVLSSPIAKSVTYYSTGLGFMLAHNVVLDAAYHYQVSKQTDYLFYYADEFDAQGNLLGSNASDIFNTEFTRHGFALTLGVRF